MLDHITQLKAYYKELKWYQKWFFPTTLKKQLEDATHSNPEISQSVSNLDIIKTILDTSWSGVWFFHSFFYSGLKDFLSAPAVNPCRWLLAHGLLTSTVVEHNKSEQVATFIRIIHENLNNTQEELMRAIMSFSIFVRNEDVGAQSLFLQSHAENLLRLNEKALLNTSGGCSNFNGVIHCLRPHDLRDCLKLLDDSGCLTQENLNVLFKSNIESVKNALVILSENNLLNVSETPHYVEIVLSHQNQYGVYEAFRLLQSKNLLNRENINSVAHHMSPAGVAQCLIQMSELDLLNEARGGRNRLALRSQKNPQYIKEILNKLKDIANSQDIFDSVLKYASVFCDDELMVLWRPAQLKMVRWIEMLMICIKGESEPDKGRASWKNYAQSIQMGARKSSHDLLSGGRVNLAALLEKGGIQDFQGNLETFARILVQLESAQLLSEPSTAQAHLNLVLNHNNLPQANQILGIAIQAQLLAGENAADYFKTLMEHYDLGKVLQIFQFLVEVNLFNPIDAKSYFSKIMSFEQLDDILVIFRMNLDLLKNEHARENLNKVFEHKKRRTLGEILVVMKDMQLDDQENFNAVMNFKLAQLDELLAELENLKNKRQDGTFYPNEIQENFKVLVKSASPKFAMIALENLKKEGLLNQIQDARTYRTAIAKSRAPKDLSEAFVSLYKELLLSPNPEASLNRDALMNSPMPKQTANSLIKLARKGLLHPNPHSSEHRTLVLTSPVPQEMVEALILLDGYGGILYPNEDACFNHEILKASQMPVALAKELIKLNEAQVLKNGVESQEIRLILRHSKDVGQMVGGMLELANANRLIPILSIMHILGREGLLDVNCIEANFLYFSGYADILCHPEVIAFLTSTDTPIEQKQALIQMLAESQSLDDCVDFIQKSIVCQVVEGLINQGIFAQSTSEPPNAFEQQQATMPMEP